MAKLKHKDTIVRLDSFLEINSTIYNIETDILKPNKFNVFEILEEDDYNKLKQDIKTNGIQTPLIVKIDNTILAGHNRFKIAKELNLKTVPVKRYDKNLTEKEEEAYVIKDNLLRRQLSLADKIKYLAILYPEQFDDALKGNRYTSKKSKTLKDVANETGQSESSLKKSKKIHLEAKTIARNKNKNNPSVEDYNQAIDTQNKKRRVKQGVQIKNKSDTLNNVMNKISLHYGKSSKVKQKSVLKELEKIVKKYNM